MGMLLLLIWMCSTHTLRFQWQVSLQPSNIFFVAARGLFVGPWQGANNSMWRHVWCGKHDTLLVSLSNTPKPILRTRLVEDGGGCVSQWRCVCGCKALMLVDSERCCWGCIYINSCYSRVSLCPFWEGDWGSCTALGVSIKITS